MLSLIETHSWMGTVHWLFEMSHCLNITLHLHKHKEILKFRHRVEST